MSIKKPLVVIAAVATISVAGLTGLGVASAASNNAASGSNIIDKIATKFNLDKKTVAAVFEEARAERGAEQQQRLEERLSKAVSEGKLTEEQKAKLLAKLAELKAEREANRETVKNMTKEELRAFHEQHAEDLKAWAEQNGIPEEFLPKLTHKVAGPGEHIIKEAPGASPNEN